MTNKTENKAKKTKEVEVTTETSDITQDADVFSEVEIQKHLDDLKKSGKKYKSICKLF